MHDIKEDCYNYQGPQSEQVFFWTFWYSSVVVCIKLESLHLHFSQGNDQFLIGIERKLDKMKQ